MIAEVEEPETLLIDPSLTAEEVKELWERENPDYYGATKRMADKIGVSTAAIRYWKSGDSTPSLHHIGRLLIEYGTPTGWPDEVAFVQLANDGNSLTHVVIGEGDEVADEILRFLRETKGPSIHASREGET